MTEQEKLSKGICVCVCDCRRGMTRRAIICDACKYGIHRDGFKEPVLPAVVSEVPSRWIIELALESAYQQRADLLLEIKRNEKTLEAMDAQRTRLVEAKETERLLNDAPLAG